MFRIKNVRGSTVSKIKNVSPSMNQPLPKNQIIKKQKLASNIKNNYSKPINNHSINPRAIPNPIVNMSNNNNINKLTKIQQHGANKTNKIFVRPSSKRKNMAFQYKQYLGNINNKKIQNKNINNQVDTQQEVLKPNLKLEQKAQENIQNKFSKEQQKVAVVEQHQKSIKQIQQNIEAVNNLVKQKQEQKIKQQLQRQRKQRQQQRHNRKKIEQQQQLQRTQQAQQQIQKILQRRKERQQRQQQQKMLQAQTEQKLKNLYLHPPSSSQSCASISGLLHSSDPLAHFQISDSIFDLQIKKILKMSFHHFPSGEAIQRVKGQLARINQSYEMVQEGKLKQGLKNYRVQLFNRIGQIIVKEGGIVGGQFAVVEFNPNQNAHQNGIKVNNTDEIKFLRGVPKDKINYVVKQIVNQEMRECSICLEDIEIGDKCHLLICNHAFHITCSQEWIQSTANCPTCRKNLKF